VSNTLVIGMYKTGTTIVASVIEHSLPGATLYFEPRHVGFLEKLGRAGEPAVVKLIYEHWMHRPFLLNGIFRGEAEFRPDKSVAIIRDPRDGMISALMYAAYQFVLDGAGRGQIDEWVEVIRAKEASPGKHSLIELMQRMNRIFKVSYPLDWFIDSFASYSAWLSDVRDLVHVLRYEDFVAGDTTALAAYLGVRVKKTREVLPGLQRVSRTRGSGDWRKLMLPEDVAHWKPRYGEALAAHGYTDWELRSAPGDPAEGSAYVMKIAEEAFRSRAQATN
jgi:hypothetical protein